MSTVLTIRAPETLRQALRLRARAEGKAVSEVAREILESALTDEPMAARVGHLRGCLETPMRGDDPWRSTLRERNWRP